MMASVVVLAIFASSATRSLLSSVRTQRTLALPSRHTQRLGQQSGWATVISIEIVGLSRRKVAVPARRTAAPRSLRSGPKDQGVVSIRPEKGQDDGPDVGVTLRRCVHVTKGSPLNLANSGASPAVRCLLNKVHLNYAYEPS